MASEKYCVVEREEEWDIDEGWIIETWGGCEDEDCRCSFRLRVMKNAKVS